MSKPLPTSRSEACPICEDTKGKCRILEDNAWMCFSYADLKVGQTIGGYKCVKDSKNNEGLWATFKIDNSAEWTEAQREEWRREKERREESRQRQLEQKRQKCLDPIARDKEYRRLFAELTLNDIDRKGLQERGFTDEQIDNSLYRSVERYQELQGQYNPLLPGMNPTGNKLLNAHAGCLIPIFQDGLIVACQVRVRILPVGDGNRYRWLSTQGNQAHLFPEGSKPEGELPLQMFFSSGEPRGVALVEGTGAKPDLARHRLGMITIGAAGGQFASSPATFREALKLAADRMGGSKKLVIYPDAGDVINKQVLHRWRKVSGFVESCGWSVEFAWWGQATKEECDIDELPLNQLRKIQLLPADEFFPFAFAHLKRDQSFKFWEKSRQFTADHSINQRYFSWDLPAEGSATFIKSGLGTGKTHWLSKTIKLCPNEGWIALGYRNNLLIQSATRWSVDEKFGFYHLQEDNAVHLLADPHCRVVACVDSLHHFKPEHFNGKNLIIDEACSVLAHLLFAKTAVAKHRQENKDKLIEALRRAKRVFVLDGLLTDKDVAYLQQLIGDTKTITKIENTFTGNAKTIKLLTGAVDGRKLRLNDRSPLVALIKKSPCCAIATDSQVDAEALDDLLTQEGRKVVRVDSKTSPEQWVKELLEDTTAWIEREKPDVFIYTPSAESGIDIAVEGYFKHFFALFFGAVFTNAQQQMLGRIRDTACPTYVYCRTAGIPGDRVSRATLPDELMKEVTDFVIADGMATLTGEEPNQALNKFIERLTHMARDGDHFHYECQLLAIANHEQGNLRECLKRALTLAGHTVKECSMEAVDITDLDNAKEEVKQRTAQNIFDAPTISIEEANRLAQKGRTWADQCKVFKARLIARIPGIQHTDRWSPDFIKRVQFDERQLISKAELLWLTQNVDIAKRLQQSKFFKYLESQKIDLNHHRSRFLMAEALESLGILKFLEPEFQWDKDSQEVLDLCGKLNNSKTLQQRVKLKSKNLEPVAVVGQLLKKLGLDTNDEFIKEGEGGRRVYTIDKEIFEDSDRVEIMKAFPRRYQDLLEGKVDAIDWAIVLSDLPEPKSEAEREIEADHLGTEFYTNQWECDPKSAIIPAENAPVTALAEQQDRTHTPQRIEPDHLGTEFYTNQWECDPDSAISTVQNAPVSLSSPVGVALPHLFESLPETQETIEEMAGFLSYCKCERGVRDLLSLEGVTLRVWRSAFALISPEQRQAIGGWVRQILGEKSMVFTA